jgi:predicted flap endonuclease-1-like 5' DNA nuclease
MDGGTQAPEKFIINGQEYSSEDATRYIDLGRKYQDIETKLNTSLDKVYPEFTKATQRNKELETELSERNKRLEELQKKNETPRDTLQAKQALRGIGGVTDDYLNEQGYIRKTELDEYFNQKQTQQKLIDNVLNQAGALEKEIDGSDGRVPFNQKAVLAYASQYEISDLKSAYEEMNEGGNRRWKEAEIERAARPGLTTLGPGGKKIPADVKVTDDNFKALWDEMFPNG